MTVERERGFFVAAFGIDGELEGIARSAFSKLSAKWLDICGQFLGHYGEAFTAPWSGKLAHIQTRGDYCERGYEKWH